MSMKIERSSLDQVKARLELNKAKQEEKKKQYVLEERLKEVKEEEERQKALKKEKKKEAKSKKADDNLDNDAEDEMRAIMGFSGFGGSIKNF